MKKLLFSSTLAMLFNINAIAGDYTKTDDLDATVTFVSTLVVTIEDLAINNAVQGDILDYENDISIPAKDPNRNLFCGLDTTDLYFSSDDAIDVPNFTISDSLSINNTCSKLSISGTLPNADNNANYSASATLSVAYATTIHR